MSTTNTSYQTDSPNALESGTAVAPNYQTMVSTSGENNEVTWVSYFHRLDRALSGSLLQICYRIIDIIILSIGLSSHNEKCTLSNRLAITSICLLVFYFIDLLIITFYLKRNASENHRRLSEEEKNEHNRRVSALRGFFIFFKLIPVCFGTSYAFTSTLPQSNDCELMRFCLGTVCLSTFLTIIIPPTKPDIPARRSLLMEIIVILFLSIINGTYIGTIASAMKNVHQSSCTYNTSQDLYLRAPLKTYALAGIILFSCTTAIHIINVIITQLCNRCPTRRQLYINFYGLQYTLSYFGAIIIIYYFSIGALLLFQPRSGEPCRTDAPTLYKTLLVWQWIRMLAPLIAVPLILILCCLGVFLGIILSYCLPASITVPLLEALQGWLSAAPVQLVNPNPPATQENIDALPVVVYGREADPFNQTECSICRVNFEANEEVKKLECGHLFHADCVATWLRITRICPVCRQRMSTH